MKRLAIIGSGDFAFQIAEFAEESQQYEVVGYIDSTKSIGEQIGKYTVLANDIEAEQLYNNGIIDCVFVGVGYLHFDLRQNIYEKFKGKIPFATIIMPSAKLGKDTQIGEGVFIGEGSIVSDRTIIDDNVVILKENFIAHDNVVNKHTYIAGRVQTAGFVTIGERCFVGLACLFADHISVCDDVWLTLGCIVARKIKKPGKYVSPAIKLVNIG